MKRPGRPMFRVVLLLLAWATAGAIVNVAVAWACVRFRSVGDSFDWDVPLTPTERVWVEGLGLGGLNIDQVVVSRYHSTGVELRQYTWDLRALSSNGIGLGLDLAAGLPFPSFRGRLVPASIEFDDLASAVRNSLPAYRSDFLGQRATQINGWSDQSLRESFPIVPIWPGFAINTVFYAAMLWMLFAAPFALRKRRRIKRGLCPKCGYDLRGRERGRSPASDASACPECGTAGIVPPRAPPGECEGQSQIS